MDAHRFDGVVSASIEDEGRGAMLVVRNTDGRTLTIEISNDQLPTLATLVLNIATGTAERSRLPTSRPGDGAAFLVNVGATGVATYWRSPDQCSIVFRVGNLDFDFPLDAGLAKFVADGLLHPAVD